MTPADLNALEIRLDTEAMQDDGTGPAAPALAAIRFLRQQLAERGEPVAWMFHVRYIGKGKATEFAAIAEDMINACEAAQKALSARPAK